MKKRNKQTEHREEKKKEKKKKANDRSIQLSHLISSYYKNSNKIIHQIL